MPCPHLWYELGRSPCSPTSSSDKPCLCGKAAAVANGELSAARALTLTLRSAPAGARPALPTLSADDRTRIGLLHAHLTGAFAYVPRLLVEPAAASASRMVEQLREFISIPSVSPRRRRRPPSATPQRRLRLTIPR